MLTALGIDYVQLSGLKKFSSPVIDHEPIEAVSDLAPQKHEDIQITSKFDYNRADWAKFKGILANSIEIEGNIDELNEKVTNTYSSRSGDSKFHKQQEKIKFTTIYPKYD